MKNKRLSKPTPKAIDQFLAHLTNESGILSYEDMARKAMEMGYEPNDLIDASLGSIKYDKSGASLEKPLEDILNDIYSKDKVPGQRFIIDPQDVNSKKAKEILQLLQRQNLEGVAVSENFGTGRSLPRFIALKNAKDDLDKLKAISIGGHEIKHLEDYFIRPDIKNYVEDPFKKGHHAKGIYEVDELNREVKNLPEDEKVIKEVLKQNKKNYLKPGLFTKLRGYFGPLANAYGVYSALKAKDSKAAALEAAALVDPTGVADAAAEVNRRLGMSKEEQEESIKEDFYSGMPEEIANEYRMMDQLKKLEEPPKKFKTIKKVLDPGIRPDSDYAKEILSQEVPLEEIAPPVEKINPSDLGERISPDLEEMDNVKTFKEYLDKKKKQFGY